VDCLYGWLVVIATQHWLVVIATQHWLVVIATQHCLVVIETQHWLVVIATQHWLQKALYARMVLPSPHQLHKQLHFVFCKFRADILRQLGTLVTRFNVPLIIEVDTTI